MSKKFVIFRALMESGVVITGIYECFIKNDDIYYFQFIEECIKEIGSNDSIIRVEKHYK